MHEKTPSRKRGSIANTNRREIQVRSRELHKLTRKNTQLICMLLKLKECR